MKAPSCALGDSDDCENPLPCAVGSGRMNPGENMGVERSGGRKAKARL